MLLISTCTALFSEEKAAQDEVIVFDEIYVLENDTLPFERLELDSNNVIFDRYLNKLDSIASKRTYDIQHTPLRKLDAYNLPIASPVTLSSVALLESFLASSDSVTDARLQRLRGYNKSLAAIYVRAPWLVKQTDKQILAGGELRSDINTQISNQVYETYTPSYEQMPTYADFPVHIRTFHPNFWRYFGKGSLQFTQSYFSNNWFQGGENNYAALALLEFHANYNNKQKVLWENTLEAQLGFQTTQSDDKHSLKPTSNLLRLTSRFGYKAYKTLYYSTQVQGTTQMANLYKTNTDEIITAFLAPLNINVSVGLDLKFNSAGKAFTGSLYMAPLVYDMRYCRFDELCKRYGIEEGKNTLNNVGSSITLNFAWKIWRNISWTSRMYWFTNYTYHIFEMENTIDFTINRFLSAKFFLYPRYDASSEKFNDEENGWGYFMLKQWLSLGLAYSF